MTFDLSGKIRGSVKHGIKDYIYTEDIKEAVRLLKEELDDSLVHIKRDAPSTYYMMEGYVLDVKEVFDKIFGDKLS